MKSIFVALLFSVFYLSGQAQIILNGYGRVHSITGSAVTLGILDQTNHSFAASGEIILMQMQGDVIGSNTSDNSSFGNLSSIGSVGLYERLSISSISTSSSTNVYNETFTVADGTTSTANWSRSFTVSGSNTSQVLSNQYRAGRTSTVWTTIDFDVSSYSFINISGGFSGTNLESGDNLTFSYSTNSGSSFTTIGTHNGSNSSVTLSVSNLTGLTTVRLRVQSNVDNNNEAHFYDNIVISGTRRILNLSTTPTVSFVVNANSSVQAITYPTMQNSGSNYSTTADITGIAWNGFLGGVIAFRVPETLILNHNISANGLGFRGGSAQNGGGGSCTTYENHFRRALTSGLYANKGEGIYRVTNTLYEAARAKILNGGGGGNDHNGGGGGGGNYTAGGNGGFGWIGASCNTNPCFGFGGIALSSVSSSSRVYMGGGGGGGQGNNSFASNGANGGGIIIIRANSVQTSGSCSGRSITAHGNNANDTNGGGNDGAGGGGAGGTIVFSVGVYSGISSSCQVTIRANGGNGGDVLFAEQHGAGAGGGEGQVYFPVPLPIANVNTGNSPGTPGTECGTCGAGSTTSGGDSGGASVFDDSEPAPLPVELVSFTATRLPDKSNKLNWTTASEINSEKFFVTRTINGKDWSIIGSVDAAGNSNSPLYYQFVDKNPVGNVQYYRLRQRDFDGSLHFSGIVSVSDFQNIAYDDLSIIPNPNSGLFEIVYDKMDRVEEIQVFDQLGKIQSVEISYKGTGAILQMKDFAKGIFHVKLIGKGQVLAVKRMIIQ